MTDVPRATVRDETCHVRVNIPEGPLLTTVTGSRRKVYGLRLTYTRTPGTDRVDVIAEFRHDSQIIPPIVPRPQWLTDVIEQFRPKYHIDKGES